MKLDGRELAGYIKQRHFAYISALPQNSPTPHLAIVDIDGDPSSNNKEVVSNKFVQLKQEYGEDVGADVSLHQPGPDAAEDTIRHLNDVASVHGILVQLPLPANAGSREPSRHITPEKDVDALNPSSVFNAPTPAAILWLLSGYGIDWHDKTIGLIGQGRLVGKPLAQMLRQSGIDPLVCDKNTGSIEEVFRHSDIIITATGEPRLIKREHIPEGSIVVDAGAANKDGVIVGDVDPAVSDREDITISPVPGGVGPLTVCALFDNLLSAFEGQSS